jgi:hypothetical protein
VRWRPDKWAPLGSDPSWRVRWQAAGAALLGCVRLEVETGQK